MRRGAFLALVCAACASDAEATIGITTGEETDALLRAPAPTTLIVEKLGLDGAKTEMARTSLPAETFSLGDHPRTEAGAIVVRGLDATGAEVVHGETLFIQWGALELASIDVFVQRTGELARMPRGPAAFEPESVITVSGRSVFLARDKTALVYDLLALRSIETAAALPRPARSMLAYGSTLIVIDETGASTLDLSDGTTSELRQPPGGSFGEVSGGATVEALDGTTFVVGATRTAGGPTTRILRLDNEGNVTIANLGSPREGACATWVEGRGLVVYGGGGDTAPGAEVLAPGATTATPLPFPPDTARGCGIAPLEAGRVLVASPNVAARSFDLACTTGCVPTPWATPLLLVRAQVYGVGPQAALIVGDIADGTTHAYRASPEVVREIPLKVPRRGARLVPLPTLSAAIVGGGAGIESYRE